ncbi:MAG TPA: nucleoside 2-deoxyribosyltransferase [Anaerolineales bacterium]|nr:nucleoside 2-deoxyribosyltransferase [Anaerolineales bacterium]
MKSIYIAGPLFNTAERTYLEHIAEVLEKAGFKTFLPHRDVGVIQQLTAAERARIFYGDLRALEQHDICVALLTGPDHDSGTSAELGYCYARGKPCYGVTDDIRWLNNFIWGVCNDGRNIVKHPEDLLEKLT